MDPSGALPAAGPHKERCQLMGARPLYAVPGDLAKVFSVSTDYLLGIECNACVNVTGLCDRDVALLADLAERLRERKE